MSVNVLSGAGGAKALLELLGRGSMLTYIILYINCISILKRKKSKLYEAVSLLGNLQQISLCRVKSKSLP